MKQPARQSPANPAARLGCGSRREEALTSSCFPLKIRASLRRLLRATNGSRSLLVLVFGLSALPAPPALAAVLAQPAPPKQDLFATLVGSAASIDMETPVTVRVEFDPPVVAVGGRAIYRITLNALDESVKLPDALPSPKGLELLPGARAQNYVPTGGQKLQPQTTINYRATATATGSFTMPAYTLTAYGQAVPVPETRLEVVPAGTPGVRAAPTLLLTLPKDGVYVGQALRVPVSLLDPGDGSVQGLSGARIIGEAIFSEPIPSGPRHAPVFVNGQAYPAVSQDVIVTPIREGRQTLVGQAVANFNRPPTGQPGVFQMLSSLVDSDPVELLVQPVPEQGRLPGFSGAVGGFQIEPPKLSTNTVRAGDPLTVTVTVRGDAGLGRLVMPPLPLQPDWQSFPPVAETLPPYLIQQRGQASFTYTLIPLSDRIKGTPPIPFSCFDPARKAYVDLTIPPVPVKVEPAPAGALAQKRPTTTTPGGPGLRRIRRRRQATGAQWTGGNARHGS